MGTITMTKLVQGIGFNEKDYTRLNNGKQLKEYALWNSMLLRCTQKYWDKKPTYAGVTCSENFKSFSFFFDWCQDQVGFGNIDDNNISWNLDKDILVKGNKVYSEDVCVFVPQRINSIIIKNELSRGGFPIGVDLYKRTNKYRSAATVGKGTQKHLGYYDTPHEAFVAYKTYKEQFIKEVANEYKEQLDSRVYLALIRYTVNLND